MDERTASELKAEWAKRSVSAVVSDLGACRDFHARAMNAFDGARYSAEGLLASIPVADLKPAVASERIAGVIGRAVEDLSAQLVKMVSAFESIAMLYKDRQTKRLAELPRPTDPAAQAGYQIRIESLRGQLEALEIGARFQAAWTAASAGRGDVIEAAELSLVPLFDGEQLVRLKEAYAAAATPEETKARLDSEAMLDEVRRIAGQCPFVLKGVLGAYAQNNLAKTV